MIYMLTKIPYLTTIFKKQNPHSLESHRSSHEVISSTPSNQSDLTCKFMIWLIKIYYLWNTNNLNLSYQVPLQGVQLLPVSLQVMYGARQVRRAPSLHQRETPIEANSTEASDKSNLDTPNLRGGISVKKMMQKIGKRREWKSIHVRHAKINIWWQRLCRQCPICSKDKQVL